MSHVMEPHYKEILGITKAPFGSPVLVPGQEQFQARF